VDISTMIEKACPVPREDHLYRALNPKHHDGLPGDNHFVMSRKHAPGDGISTGIASRISVSELRSIDTIKRVCSDSFGVAELAVSEVLAPVAALGISVVQVDAIEWGIFSGAHAVITGYQVLAGNDGKRKIQEFQRHLVRLAQRRYYAAGSDTPVSVA
jgi:hypothetical protein